MLRTFGSLAVVAMILFLSSGCAGYGESVSERSHRWSTVAAYERYGLVDDIDLVLQTDRPSRLTRWHSK